MMTANTVPISLEFTTHEYALLAEACLTRCIDVESLIREATHAEAARLEPTAVLPPLTIMVHAPLLFQLPVAAL